MTQSLVSGDRTSKRPFIFAKRLSSIWGMMFGAMESTQHVMCRISVLAATARTDHELSACVNECTR